MLGMLLANSAGASVTPDELCDLHFASGAVLINIPTAKTVSAQARGLSGIDDAGPGLLFTWSNAEPRVFWMRDTRMRLSVGFFDQGGRLFAIEHMEPMTDRFYFSIEAASDALELPHGEFERLGISVGDRLLNRACRP